MTLIGYILRQDILKFIAEATLDELIGGITAIGSNPAVPGDEKQWESYRPTAIEMIKGYSRHWYDIDLQLREYIEFNIAEAFTLGNRVASVPDVDGIRTLYDCIQDAPIGTLLTDTAFFTENDSRNAVLVEIACILVIYNISRRRNPRQIPEQRILDYDNAIKMLSDIQRGKLSLDIAERVDVETDDAGQEFAYGEFDGLSHDTY